MKVRLDNNDSTVVKNNDTYVVIDNTHLNGLVTSKTVLHPNKETTGHVHPGKKKCINSLQGLERCSLEKSFTMLSQVISS